VSLKDTQTGKEWEHTTDGVFVFIGHIPNTGLFQGQLEIGEQGYLVSDELLATNVEGVWAAGETTDAVFRQAITSAGMGAAAAIQAQRWLDEQE
jgi:thioredoxin reductase (NADPH)